MTLAEITMPKTRGVMPVVDGPSLDALLVPETGEAVEVWVTTVVDLSEEVDEVMRGAWVVAGAMRWEEVDEVMRLLVEDEMVGRTDGVETGTTEGATEGTALVLALVVVGA